MMAMHKNPFAVGMATLLLLCGATSKSEAGSFGANFTCSYDLGRALYPMYTPWPSYNQAGVSEGFSYSFGAGSLSISQAAGVGNAQLRFLTTFLVSGNFTASVVVSRQYLGAGADSGIAVTDEFGNPLMDIFFQGSNQTVANVFPLTPNPLYVINQKIFSDSETSGTFIISRDGNVLRAKYGDGGSSIVAIESADNAGYSVPVRIQIGLGEIYGDTGAHQVSYSSLKISSVSLDETCKSPNL